jgi:hypothetical protein
MKSRRRNPRNKQGVALVLTLGVMAVVLLMLIGFVVSMRTEMAASHSFSHEILAKQLAQAAAEEAILLISTNTPILDGNNFWVSQPGRIVRTNFQGSYVPTIDERLFSVFTNADGQGAGLFNLNRDQVIIGSNAVYNLGINRMVQAAWIPMGTNGALTGMGGEPIIGRYCYWVDEEGAKLNINTAMTNNSPLSPTPRHIDLGSLPNLGPDTALNSYNYAQNTGYFSTAQWKITEGSGTVNPGLYNENKFYITAYSDGEDFTPWGTQKWWLNTNFDAWKAEIDGGCTNTLNCRYLTNWFGAGNTFTNKYGGLPMVKQIAANICDFQFRAGGSALACIGAQGFGGAGQLDSGGAGWYGVPREYHGLRRYPYLNEIGVQATYWKPSGGVTCGAEIQCKIYIIVEVVNPYNQAWGSGGQIRVNMDKLRFRVSGDGGAWNYVTGPDTGWSTAWQSGLCVPYQSAQEITYNITNNIPANSYTNFILEAYAGREEGNGTALVDEVSVHINKVRLLQTADDDTTIRDWAIRPDFDTRSCSSATAGAGHFCFDSAHIQNSSSFPGYNNSLTQGIAKNDPRVRRFTTWSPPGDGVPTVEPWTPVGYGDSYAATLPDSTGAENSVVNFLCGTGLPNVTNDPPTTSAGVVVSVPVVVNPSFVIKTDLVDTNYESSGELGYIHTGLQWRTLLLQPRPAAESTANLIPDWAVLDIFSVTNMPIRGRININAAITNFYTGNANWKLRTEPLTGLMTAVKTGNNLGFTTDQPLIAANIYTMAWAASSSWPATRTNPPCNFTPGLYNFVGELCEIAKVSTNWNPNTHWTNDAVREGRIRSFANWVTVRSEQFTIWSVGQAIKDVDEDGIFTPGKDKILAEAKAETVVQRLQNLNGTPNDPSDDTVQYKVIHFGYMTD